MPETPQTQREISELTTRLANVEQMVRFGLAASGEAKRYATDHFNSMKNSAPLYIALREPQTQQQLCVHLKLSHPQVSKLCTHLEEQGYIAHEKNPSNRKELVYRWTEVERIIGLSKIALDCVKRSKK